MKAELDLEKFKKTTHYSHVIEAQKEVEEYFVNFGQPEPEIGDELLDMHKKLLT